MNPNNPNFRDLDIDPGIDQTDIEIAARSIAEAKYPVALTGAGISVPSGIPDFRSPGSGMWERDNPMEVCHIDSFRKSPERFYKWIQPLVEGMSKALPNAAHYALALLQQVGCLNEIITQNIDGLHEDAISKNVVAVHGDCTKITCIDCDYEEEATKEFWEDVSEGHLPECPYCGTYTVKPNIVMFGEMLDVGVMDRAYTALEKCDCLIVIGTALEVMPVSMMPSVVEQAGGSLVILNIGETSMDLLANVKISEDVALVLPQLVRKVIEFREGQ